MIWIGIAVGDRTHFIEQGYTIFINGDENLAEKNCDIKQYYGKYKFYGCQLNREGSKTEKQIFFSSKIW